MSRDLVKEATELLAYWNPKAISLGWLQRKMMIGFNESVEVFHHLENLKVLDRDGAYLKHKEKK